MAPQRLDRRGSEVPRVGRERGRLALSAPDGGRLPPIMGRGGPLDYPELREVENLLDTRDIAEAQRRLARMGDRADLANGVAYLTTRLLHARGASRSGGDGRSPPGSRFAISGLSGGRHASRVRRERQAQLPAPAARERASQGRQARRGAVESSSSRRAGPGHRRAHSVRRRRDADRHGRCTRSVLAAHPVDPDEPAVVDATEKAIDGAAQNGPRVSPARRGRHRSVRSRERTNPSLARTSRRTGN